LGNLPITQCTHRVSWKWENWCKSSNGVAQTHRRPVHRNLLSLSLLWCCCYEEKSVVNVTLLLSSRFPVL